MFHTSGVPGFRGDGIHIGCISSSVACIQPGSVDIPFVFQAVLLPMTDFGVTSMGWCGICTGSHWLRGRVSGSGQVVIDCLHCQGYHDVLTPGED